VTASTPRAKRRASVQPRKARAQLDETRKAETTSEAGASGDEFAAQLATVMFEWRPTRVSSVPPPVSELWMSRVPGRSVRTAR
jgi:hypothetical protein